MPETAAKPRRPWFRFSLRTLLVVLTGAAALFGWLRHTTQLVEYRRKVAEEINSHGGHVLDYYPSAEFRTRDASCGRFCGKADARRLKMTSALRRWLGDIDGASVHVTRESDAKLARDAFPESLEIICLY
jgi:hypothetical protein